MSEEEGYIKRECCILWALAACEIMEEDNLDFADVWIVKPYIGGILE